MEAELDLDPNEEAESQEMEKKLKKAKDKIFWRTKANELLDEYQLKLNYASNETAKPSTIFFNSNQGKRMNCGIDNNLQTHNVLLFLITKETELLGEMIKNEFCCDFLLLKFEQPFVDMKYDT